MWIFTDTSFVSIVRPKNGKGRKDPLVVRGRVKGDIEAKPRCKSLPPGIISIGL